ncbi:MAG: hypothetical protein IPM80_09175 [Proteobacteria bacterium]|nr:hypothetical protein [Pseudomonadota bacterium]
MASEITLFTQRRRDWKAEVEARKNNALVYKSIGTVSRSIIIASRLRTSGVTPSLTAQGGPAHFITNVYRGSGRAPPRAARPVRKASLL